MTSSPVWLRKAENRGGEFLQSPGEDYIICENLVKIYQVSELEVFALQGLDLTVKKGELMAIIGASGSGKSSLLNILGGLDTPTGGKVRVGRWNLNKISKEGKGAKEYKRRVVGFVWQNVSRNLIPYLTALENVELPMIFSGNYDRQWAKELLLAVSLGDRMNHKPSEMSGGQQQRVAIAVALANKPELLLADEPTGSLDKRTGQLVLEVFRRVRDIFGVTVVIVTHDMSIAEAVDRYVRIRDGKISTESVRRTVAQNGLSVHPGEKDEDRETGATWHEEYAVLDSAGRLQIPEEFRAKLGISRQVKLQLEDGRILVLPPD
ncbi:MAG TPA: ABC transporter ATP-binding protein [Firmicutes bacterium]|nr:ABC transporter ATP-binding protein [Bacillota bacterium]